jgi:hypothetical protein
VLGGGLCPPSDGRRVLALALDLPPPSIEIAAAEPPLGTPARSGAETATRARLGEPPPHPRHSA